MNSQNLQVKQRTCFKCGFFAETAETICPQCKRQLQTSTSVRVRGFLAVLCGGFLIAMMTYLSLWMVNVVKNGDQGQARFNGTHEQMLMIFGLFGFLLLFGFVSFFTGLWQLILGRRNKFATWVVVALGILLYVGGAFIVWRFDG